MDRKEHFLKRAKEQHGDKFDYSKYEYVDAKTRSTIICPVHGEFEQTPDKHIRTKFACNGCSRELKHHPKHKDCGVKLKYDVFVDRFISKHGDKFELIMDNYSGLFGSDISIICKEHGEIFGNPQNFLSTKYACVLCANRAMATRNTQSYEYVIGQLNEKHRGRYKYPAENKEIYVNKRSKIKVICEEHGEFIKTARDHLIGQGCFKCRMSELVSEGKLLGGYSDVYFENNPDKKDQKAILYYVKVGNIYKVGITTNLQNRLSGLRYDAKKQVDLVLSKEYTLFDAYHLEQLIFVENSERRLYTKWSTELFKEDISEHIKQYFEETT